MNPSLSKSELKTLLDMARACKTLEDAQDTVDLYSKLSAELKPQLRAALKRLPIGTKQLLRDAAMTEQRRAA